MDGFWMAVSGEEEVEGIFQGVDVAMSMEEAFQKIMDWWFYEGSKGLNSHKG